MKIGCKLWRIITQCRREIKILMRGEFNFHTIEFVILILILKNNSNTLINENENDFLFPSSIPNFQHSKHGLSDFFESIFDANTTNRSPIM